MEFAFSSPLGWHAGVWAMLLNVGVVAVWQRLYQPVRNEQPLSDTPTQ
jgi:solute:Na+ symporter, SSS family